nr:hypothetical protein CFP56_75815 [Quercus suber]
MNPESLTSATFATPSGRPASILKDSASVKAEEILPRSDATLLTGDSESPLAASMGTNVTRWRGVLTVVSVESNQEDAWPRKKVKLTREPIAFDDDNLEGTTQPHDDAFMVTAWINGFIVKSVLADQGSGVEVMYLDLFKGLGLKVEDLSKYDTPLMGFDARMVIPNGQISLPVNTEEKEVMVNFIVVGSFSPYMAILGRPWIHTMGVVPSTLHVKVKFHTNHGVAIVRGDQQVAR